MVGAGWTLFDTPIGRCGIGWSAAGISSVRLPPAFGRPAPTPVPANVRRVLDAMMALLDGSVIDDLSWVPVDLDGVGTFDRAVYQVARTVPPGAVVTYGEVARRIGHASEAREVGKALGRNPVPIVVPCHRVVAANGKLGGFSAPGGASTKQRLLALEGAITPTLPFA